MNEDLEIELIEPKNQLSLFGYDAYFEAFTKLFEKKEMPHCVLLSGTKGLGKSTFIYHFINYLFSKTEKNKYSINDLIINKENLSYKNKDLLQKASCDNSQIPLWRFMDHQTIIEQIVHNQEASNCVFLSDLYIFYY